MRKFEEVTRSLMKFPKVETKLPERATSRSGAYDFYSKEDVELAPGEYHTFFTDVKINMFFDNVLLLFTRSGNGCKRGLVLRNNVGVIDADYADGSNGGNIGVCLVNQGDEKISIHVGDRIAQGIVTRYLICDDDKYMNYKEEPTRTGGFGSTGV